MITVSNYHVRQRKDGEKFIVLTLQGGLELVQSQTTGQFRGVVRKCQIPASFNEETAKLVIGTQIPGSIVRMDADPYSYTDEKTGEMLTLAHKWVYMPVGATAPLVVEQELEVDL
mgnify:CR=1 FL=1